MATKWKYANLDAQHRLDLLKEGNKELFDEEVARTKEITRARRELGLDTTEQENWMDTVGYNYSLSLAGVGDKVSKTGYAELYLKDKPKNSGTSPVKSYSEKVASTYRFADAKRKVAKAGDLAKKALAKEYEEIKERARNELFDRYPYLKEKLINSGASLEGGKAEREYRKLEAKLEDIYSQLDDEYKSRLSDIESRYSGIVQTLMDYKEKGTTKESFGVIADDLIRKAAKIDGFDASLIPGVIGSYRGEEDDDNDVSSDAKIPEQNRDIKSFLAEEKNPVDNADQDAELNGNNTREGNVQLSGIREYLERLSGEIVKDSEKVKSLFGRFLAQNGMNDVEASDIVEKLVQMLGQIKKAKG